MEKINPMLQQALEYCRMGMSVVPLKPDKKSYVQWKRYQKEKADEKQIKEWWYKWPDANSGIITGEISGIDSIDIDSQEAYDAINDFYLETNFISPIYKTPNKGYQIWVKHRNGLSNAADVIPTLVKGLDLRTDGGYTVAPHSKCDYEKHGRHIVGSHQWLDKLSVRHVKISDWPSMLYDTIIQSCGNRGTRGNGGNVESTPNSPWIDRFKNAIGEGVRDETLFHISNYLVKGGMPKSEAEQFLKLINSTTFNPPLSESEISIKLKSAFDRDESRVKNVLSDLREYVMGADGIFSSQEFFKATQLQQTIRIQKTVSQGFSRLVDEGVIERYGGKNGLFRKVENECDVIDFINCDLKTSSVSLPLGLDELVEVYPGNIIMLAGVSNMGKTAFMIDMIYRNMKKMDVWYFNSEMDGPELKKRLTDFRAVESLRDWKFNSRGMVENMEDVIARGHGKLNIIDYLELDQDHYKISGMIKRIHKKLDGALAVIAIQKKPGNPVGVGGYGTIYKSRLALNIEKGVCEIFKAKNWKGRRNPNGLRRKFDIIEGWDLAGRGEWYQAD
jgi:hypothetical protein